MEEIINYYDNKVLKIYNGNLTYFNNACPLFDLSMAINRYDDIKIFPNNKYNNIFESKLDNESYKCVIQLCLLFPNYIFIDEVFFFEYSTFTIYYENCVFLIDHEDNIIFIRVYNRFNKYITSSYYIEGRIHRLENIIHNK